MTYEIKRKFHHKNYVFLLSVLPGNAYWSAHKYEGDTRISIKELSQLFQKEHDIQVEAFMNEPQPEEFTDMTNIDDQTKIN